MHLILAFIMGNRKLRLKICHAWLLFMRMLNRGFHGQYGAIMCWSFCILCQTKDDYYIFIISFKHAMLFQEDSYSLHQLYPITEGLIMTIYIYIYMGSVDFKHIFGYPLGHFMLDMPSNWSSLSQINDFAAGWCVNL